MVKITGPINSHKHLCHVAGISKPFSSKAQAKKGRKAARGWTNNAAGFQIAFRLTLLHCKSKHLQNWLGPEKKNKEQFIGSLVQHYLAPNPKILVELYTVLFILGACLIGRYAELQ